MMVQDLFHWCKCNFETCRDSKQLGLRPCSICWKRYPHELRCRVKWANKQIPKSNLCQAKYSIKLDFEDEHDKSGRGHHIQPTNLELFDHSMGKYWSTKLSSLDYKGKCKSYHSNDTVGG